MSVKCEPELAVGLRDSYPTIRPGYHLNKRHWNTITLDGSLPDQVVRDLIEDSYDKASAPRGAVVLREQFSCRGERHLPGSGPSSFQRFVEPGVCAAAAGAIRPAT